MSGESLIQGVLLKSTQSWSSPPPSHCHGASLIPRNRFLKRWQRKYFRLFADRLEYHNISSEQADAGEPDSAAGPEDVRVVPLFGLTGARLMPSLDELTVLTTGIVC